MKAAVKTKPSETQLEVAKGSLGVVETQQFTFADGPDVLKLESGETLGPVTLAYETYGQLNAEKSNAILVLHALSGDAHAAGFSREETTPGWWDAMIGPGKPFDTDRYFVICSNVIGGCKGSTGPSSVEPADGETLRAGLSLHHDRRHGRRPAAPDRFSGDRQAALRGGRFDGRDAGPPVGGLLPGAGPVRHPHRHGAEAFAAADRLQRGDPAVHHGRSGLARTGITTRPASRRRGLPWPG